MTDTAMHSVQPGNETALTDIAILVSNEVLGRGLEAVLESLEGVGRVRCCTSHLAAMRALRNERYDVVILTAKDREWLAEAIGPDRPRSLMIIDTQALTDRPRLGYADGYLSLQDLSAATLEDCLRRMAGGEVPVPAELTRALLAGTETAPAATGCRPVRLTDRESEVLHLLSQGLSNKQIANRLSISSHGVKRLVGNIMMKLDAPNRTAAVVSAINAGILRPE
jgi:two-component system, NarL family, nitrate/nitrite response regulator NarL